MGTVLRPPRQMMLGVPSLLVTELILRRKEIAQKNGPEAMWQKDGALSTGEGRSQRVRQENGDCFGRNPQRSWAALLYVNLASWMFSTRPA